MARPSCSCATPSRGSRLVQRAPSPVRMGGVTSPSWFGRKGQWQPSGPRRANASGTSPGAVVSALDPERKGRSCRSSSAATRNPWPWSSTRLPQFSQDTPRLEFWDVTTGKSAPFPVRLAAGSDERVSLDGRIFATATSDVDGQCRWWDLDTGRLIDRWYPRQMGGSQPSPDAQTLLANCLGRATRTVRPGHGFPAGRQPGPRRSRLPGGPFIGEPMLIYRDGQPSAPGTRRRWRCKQRRRPIPASARLPAMRRDLEQTRELFDGGLLSPNGKLAFFNRTETGQEYGRLVDVARRQPIGPALGSQRDRNLMVFSPDEQLLALAPHNYMAGAPDPGSPRLRHRHRAPAPAPLADAQVYLQPGIHSRQPDPGRRLRWRNRAPRCAERPAARFPSTGQRGGPTWPSALTAKRWRSAIAAVGPATGRASGSGTSPRQSPSARSTRSPTSGK